jgi:hypothetical protein
MMLSFVLRERAPAKVLVTICLLKQFQSRKPSESRLTAFCRIGTNMALAFMAGLRPDRGVEEGIRDRLMALNVWGGGGFLMVFVKRKVGRWESGQ